jgi:hypothetical protein
MRKLFLLICLLIILSFPISNPEAQEACTYKCPSGSEFTDATRSKCKPATSDLTTSSISQCVGTKKPSSPEFSASCICNPPAPAPGTTAGTKLVNICPIGTEGVVLSKTTITDVSDGTMKVECSEVSNCFRRSAIGGLSSTYDCVSTTAKACAGTKDCSKGIGTTCNTNDGSVSGPEGDGVLTAIGCIPNEPQKLVESILKYGTLAAGGVAFLLMLLAAIQMITAEGNPNTIKTSQEKFYSAIIGLLLIIFSVLLMQVIGIDLLGLKGFGK